MSLSQLGPWKPVPAQLQVNPRSPSTQRPPFEHEPGRQSSTLVSQMPPVKPVPEQSHVTAFTPS